MTVEAHGKDTVPNTKDKEKEQVIKSWSVMRSYLKTFIRSSHKYVAKKADAAHLPRDHRADYLPHGVFPFGQQGGADHAHRRRDVGASRITPSVAGPKPSDFECVCEGANVYTKRTAYMRCTIF